MFQWHAACSIRGSVRDASAQALGYGWGSAQRGILMRSGLLFLGATTIALVASASNSADLELAVQLPQAVWSWPREYIGGHLGGSYGRTSFTDLHGLPVYGDLVDTPVFLVGGQIGYRWQKNSFIFGRLGGQRCCLRRHKYLPRRLRKCCECDCKTGPDVFATGTGRRVCPDLALEQPYLNCRGQ
ncbi:hypothetical protein ACVW1A_000008 [Bradyrhizobium sp. LB1.3]